MEGKVYPTIKNSILLCLLFLGIMCGFIILPLIYLELLGIFNISFILTNLTTYTTIITFEIVVVIGFIKAARTFNEVFKFNKVSLFLWIAIIVFMVGFCIIISELENFLEYILPRPDWIRKQSESLRVMVKENFIWAIILIAIISPCIEEMFFRGLILGGLNNNYSKRTAIIMSALLFGATCLTSLNPWQILIVFITGLFAAWICINTNSILLCIYMRFFFNVLSIVTIKFGNLIPIKGFQSYNGAPVEFQRLWFDLIGLAIFIVGIILLKKGFEKTKTITQNIKQNSDSTAVRFSIKAKLILIIFSIVIVTLFLFSFILPVTSKIKTDKEKSSRENRQMYMNRIFVDEVHMDISYMIRSMQELIMTTVLNADTLFIEETKDRFFERNSQITAVFFEYPALINHPLSGEQLLINKQFFESQEIELNLVDSYFENSRSVQKRVLRGESVLLNAAPHFGIPVLACLFPMQSGVGGILFSSERITENFNKRYGAPVTIFFINGDGDILLHDDFTLVKLGINLSRDDYIRSVLDGSADAFHTDKYDFGLLQPSDNQYLVTRVYSGIAKTVMFISTDNDMSNKLIEKDAEKINQITLVFFCIFYIAAIIFVMFFSRTISNPLKVLAVAAHNIGEGNFKIPLEEKKRNDETGLLFENFQNMCKALNVFGKFTNEEIAVKAMRDEIKPGDSLNQYATILFSDIRSFTTISEGMAPDDLVNSLNRYFSGQVDIIYNRRGVVDKYIGDAIMAFWGAPEKHDDDALQSVLAGLEMIEALSGFNANQRKLGKPEFRIGVGINCGEVTVGIIGSERKMDYTVIGDSVNLASRMEGLTKTYRSELLISEFVYTELQKTLQAVSNAPRLYFRLLDTVAVKGKSKGVKIYTVKRSLNPAETAAWPVHNQGMELYYRRSFREAADKFREVYRLLAKDANAESLYRRCAEYAVNPPPAGWDGVEVMKTK